MKTALTILAAILLRTVIDIWGWRPFEAEICPPYWNATPGLACPWDGGLPGQYHFGLMWVDIGLMVVGAIALWDFKLSGLYILAYGLFVASGGADVLYYVLQGRALPVPSPMFRIDSWIDVELLVPIVLLLLSRLSKSKQL